MKFKEESIFELRKLKVKKKKKTSNNKVIYIVASLSETPPEKYGDVQ